MVGRWNIREKQWLLSQTEKVCLHQLTEVKGLELVGLFLVVTNFNKINPIRHKEGIPAPHPCYSSSLPPYPSGSIVN